MREQRGKGTKGLVREERSLKMHFTTNQSLKEILPPYRQLCLYLVSASLFSDVLLTVGERGPRNPFQSVSSLTCTIHFKKQT